MKLISIVGARPQFVKMATLSRQFAKHSRVKHLIVHTGQHYDQGMSGVFFQEMQIPEPDHNLNINSLSHGAMTGRMLERIECVYLEEKPDAVIVYGDTNSTLAGALAARKMHIPLAHVEAGLRSYNLQMPEEVNRILTDRISDFLYCPTRLAMNNLEKEGYTHFNCQCLLSGDVMLDAVRYYSSLSSEKADISTYTRNKPFVLCTLHRQENTDNRQRLESITEAINELNRILPVVMPLHPRTSKMISSFGLKLQAQITEPFSYFQMLELLKACQMVLTDSGGLQKEACFFGKYCITLRDETEWTELVDAGANFLAGSDKDIILRMCEKVLALPPLDTQDLYGDGNAAGKIAEHLVKNV